jgi:ribosomal protein L7/L12
MFGIAMLVLAAAAVLAVVGAARKGQRRIKDLQESGGYPLEGREQDADVLRLLKSGEKILAIRCYRSVHKVGLKEAKDAVEQMEKANA